MFEMSMVEEQSIYIATENALEAIAEEKVRGKKNMHVVFGGRKGQRQACGSLH